MLVKDAKGKQKAKLDDSGFEEDFDDDALWADPLSLAQMEAAVAAHPRTSQNEEHVCLLFHYKMASELVGHS